MSNETEFNDGDFVWYGGDMWQIIEFDGHMCKIVDVDDGIPGVTELWVNEDELTIADDDYDEGA